MQRPMPPIRGKGLARGIPAVLSVVSAFCPMGDLRPRVGHIPPFAARPVAGGGPDRAEPRAFVGAIRCQTITATLTGFACSAVVAFALSIILDFIMPRVRRALFPDICDQPDAAVGGNRTFGGLVVRF